MVYLMTQRIIRSPVNVCVQKGKMAISFCLHGELNVPVVIEVLQHVGTMGPDD
jgi:hypothetical protein